MIETLLYEKLVPLWDKLVSQELFSLKRKKKKKGSPKPQITWSLWSATTRKGECITVLKADIGNLYMVSPIPYGYKVTAYRNKVCFKSPTTIFHSS